MDLKAIEYMVKSKTETLMSRLKTLLLKLRKYEIHLKYQKRFRNALSRLHNSTDITDNKDVIPLNLLQHFTPNYIEHAYSHWVENLCVQKTKDHAATQVKRKRSGPRKQKIEKMKFKNQAQIHILHDQDKSIKIPKMKLFPGTYLIKLTRNEKCQTG